MGARADLSGGAGHGDDVRSGAVPGQAQFRQTVAQRVHVPEVHVLAGADHGQPAAGAVEGHVSQRSVPHRELQQDIE